MGFLLNPYVFGAGAAGNTLAAGVGSFALTGHDAVLKRSVLQAGPGSFALTGNPATLFQGNPPLLAGAGSFVLTGNAVSFRRGFSVPATAGAFALTGTATALHYGKQMAANTGALALTGNATGLKRQLRIAAGSGAFTLTGNAATLGGDPNFANVVLLCGFNGTDGATTAPDESSSAKTLTFVGNAQIDTAQSKFGGASLLLDGSGDRVTIPDSPDWDLSDANSDQYTIEAWVRFNSSVSFGQEAIVAHFNASGSLSWEFQRNGAQISLVTDSSGAGAQTTVTTASAGLVLSTWHHLAAAKDATGKVRIYIDGVMKGSATPANSNTFNAATVLAIGSTSAGARSFNGWIDELRITKGVARYASDGGFTPPTAAFPRS